MKLLSISVLAFALLNDAESYAVSKYGSAKMTIAEERRLKGNKYITRNDHIKTPVKRDAINEGVNHPDDILTPEGKESLSPSSSPISSQNESNMLATTEMPNQLETLAPVSFPDDTSTEPMPPLLTESPVTSPTANPVDLVTTIPVISPTARSVTSPTASLAPSATDSPVSSPTASSFFTPTASQAALPTSSPVASPTAGSFASPISSSVASPTASSVASPTANSVASPTASPAPTASPVASPAAIPVASPAAIPVALPTAIPVALITVIPVASPIASPVASPTASSVASPTAISVASPTASSVASPAASPAALPTANPAASPTATSIASPTASPVASPTASPNATPSESSLTVPSVSPVGLVILPTDSPSKSATNTSPALGQSFASTVPTPTKSPIFMEVESTISPDKSPTNTPSEMKTGPTNLNLPESSPTLDPKYNDNANPNGTVCQTDERGSFGDIGSVAYNPIDYLYDMELNPLSIASINDDIIPKIEEAINDKLLPLLFAEKCREQRNLLADEEQELNAHRQMAVRGISPGPRDSVEYGVPCTSDLKDEHNSCYFTEGQLWLFVANEEDKQRQKSFVLDAIKAGMEDDEFISAHADIVKLYYIENVVEVPDRIESDLTAPSVTVAEGRSVTSTLVIAAASTIALIGAIIGWRKLRKSDDDDEDSDDDSVTDDMGSNLDINDGRDTIMEEEDLA